MGMWAQAKQTRILWIGNSYTYVNDLPTMFYNLALSGGDTVVFDSRTVGGYTLNQQANDVTTLAKIASQPWDYVVIQAQSQEPSFPTGQFNTQTLPYAIILDSLVHANDSCTQTVFYMTWGKKHGDTGNCGVDPELCTFSGVTWALRRGYMSMTDTTHAIVAPVGMAWYRRWETDTLINLWQSDDSHPLVEGTYLTACTFYGTIFRKSPIGLSYSPIATQSVTDTLQLDAYHAVFDSLSNWHIGEYGPHAALSFTLDTATQTANFDAAASTNYTSYLWDFGDSTAPTANGTHAYTNHGTYTVKLTVTNDCGLFDTASQTIYIVDTSTVPDTTTNPDTTHTGIVELPTHRFSLSPNPVIAELWLHTDFKTHTSLPVEIFDALGRKVLAQSIAPALNTYRLDVSTLPKGIYLLKLNDEVQRFIKQ